MTHADIVNKAKVLTDNQQIRVSANEMSHTIYNMKGDLFIGYELKEPVKPRPYYPNKPEYTVYSKGEQTAKVQRLFTADLNTRAYQLSHGYEKKGL